MTQLSLFDPDEGGPDPKPTSDDVVRLRLLITVKAAPNPSEKYGETVCIAGRSVDLSRRQWIRLYPINFRELGSSDRFRKYDIISIDARPARSDQRNESWKPYPHTLVNEGHLQAWKPRRPWLDPLIERSMCQLNHNARANPNAQSLALIRPADVGGLKLHPHPGWTPAEQHKIDKYVEQLDLLDSRDRTPLEPPRFKGMYRYRCHDARCGGHQQGMLDWEFVAFQRRLGDVSDEEAYRLIEDQFLRRLCGADRDAAFYVGNQAKRAHVFSVLGVYYPKR
jgi:hypothetical protein